jgi:hypothetical protein
MDAGPDATTLSMITMQPSRGWTHVPVGTHVPYVDNPPSSGMHYPVWANWRIYTATFPREYYVHNLEHGGIVFLYQPTAPANVIADLTAAYNGLSNDPECDPPSKHAVMLPDPAIDTPIAVVAAYWTLRYQTVIASEVTAFVAAHRGLAGNAPENTLCVGGIDPPP